MSAQVQKKATESAKPTKKKATATQIGVVESDKRDKTRRVTVRFSAPHPKYGKYVANRTILHVHDERNESKLGDRVEIAQCRPISKTKNWKLVRVVERAPEL
jgi:small subunit ribosomal protein S17